MKRFVLILMLISVLMIFGGCSNEDIPLEDPVPKEPSLREKAYAMGYSDELIDWIYECFSEEKAENIIFHPADLCTVRESEKALCYENIYFGAWQFYHSGEGQPVYFSYLRDKNGELTIIPERLDFRYGFGVLDNTTLYFAHDKDIAFYRVAINGIRTDSWKPSGCENGLIISTFVSQSMDSIVVFWADTDIHSNYQLSLVDFNGKETKHLDTGIELAFIEGKPLSVGIVSDSTANFGIFRFFANHRYYDFYPENDKIKDITGAFGSTVAPNILPAPHLTIFEGKNGKFGLMNGEDIIVEAVFDSIKIVEPNIYNNGELPPASHFYVGAVENGTRLDLRYSEGQQVPHLVETENFEYTVFDPDGNRINDIPFNEYECYEGVCGNVGGSVHYYEFDGEKFSLYAVTEPMETQNKFGYFITEYCWNCNAPCSFGLSDGDGKVILEPIYSKIEMYFEDRICRYNGISAAMDWDFGHCEITDLDGNIICDKFDAVRFIVYDDGSYIGIGRSGMSEIAAFDENGEPMPAGFWFIDKDGNILSECYKEISNWYSDDFVNTKDGKITVILPDGTEAFVDPSDYIIK